MSCFSQLARRYDVVNKKEPNVKPPCRDLAHLYHGVPRSSATHSRTMLVYRVRAQTSPDEYVRAPRRIDTDVRPSPEGQGMCKNRNRPHDHG